MGDQPAGLGVDSPAHGAGLGAAHRGKCAWGWLYMARPGLSVGAGGCARERGMLSVRGRSSSCRTAHLQQPLRNWGLMVLLGWLPWLVRAPVSRSSAAVLHLS